VLKSFSQSQEMFGGYGQFPGLQFGLAGWIIAFIQAFVAPSQPFLFVHFWLQTISERAYGYDREQDHDFSRFTKK